VNIDGKLAEFVAAQDQVYDSVLRELAAGRKESHWIWFIFPQLAGLGTSGMAQKYALDSLDEARRYLDHAVLGPRLRECTRLVVASQTSDIGEILGYPDDLKFRSCMTLFSVAAREEPLFDDALAKFFDGERDPLTLNLLKRAS
jgi:uncharacterized protein (DUF1810 family)